MTALAAAFERAAYRTVEQRLRDAAIKALLDNPRSWDSAKDALFAVLRAEPDLHRALLGPAVERLLADTAFEMRRSQEPVRPVVAEVAIPPSSPPTPEQTAPAEVAKRPEGQEACVNQYVPALPRHVPPRDRNAPTAAAIAGNVARLSLLDTFRINGRAIGDVTPEEANGWAASRERDARFVRLLTQNLPPGLPIRRFRSGEDAQALYERAKATGE